MKKFLCAILICIMSLSLFGCGGSKPQTAVLTLDQSGILMEYKLEAKGDIVQTIIQTSTLDVSAYSSEDISAIEASLEEYAATYEAYEGVVYETEVTDTSLVETITIDATDKETLSALSDAGLLPLEGESSIISFEKTIANLEEQGWVVEE